MLKLSFLGAAKTVTGSRTLIEYNHHRYLVDCGLFQGPRSLRERNWEPFPEASALRGILLTHAHIDHSGYLPKVVQCGFRGPIFCSEGTGALLTPLLLDAAHLQEEDAEFANRTKHSRHTPALPLFTEKDARDALALVRTCSRHEWIELEPGLSFRFLRASHILGASLIQLAWQDSGAMPEATRILTFSGDLGHDRSPLLKEPDKISHTDYLVLESTYGDRHHAREIPKTELAQLVNRVAERKGVLVIPAFAVGRTQDILITLKELEFSRAIPELPVFLDSPMAKTATEIYRQQRDDHRIVEGNRFLESPLDSCRFKTISSPDESMLLCMRDGPMIVISAAGMLTGGRILHHLKQRLPDPRNAVLFIGFQSAETKGRLLQQGITTLRIHHQEVPVEAEIISLDGFSGHGDAQDLADWLAQIQRKPRTVFLNHGEAGALLNFKQLLQSRFSEIKVEIVDSGHTWALSEEAIRSV